MDGVAALGRTAARAYEAGKEHTDVFRVDAIHLPAGVKAKHLVNAGLLVASFRAVREGEEAGEQVVDVNFVVQVERDASGEGSGFRRTIFNPLEPES
jgi:hypothetical protein